MILSFLNSRRLEIIYFMSLLILFLVIFFLFNLPIEAYILAACITLFITMLYMLIRFISYKQEINLKERNSELEYKIQQLRNEQIDYQHEIESYFLMWVHQMKTPITATKLLLENPEEDVVDRVRHEILQIDNYTNLTLSYLKLMNNSTDMLFVPVTVDELIRPIIKRYSIQFIHHQTRLHYDSIESEVLTDAKWMSILLEQLINNALKYARGKDIWIEYDTRTSMLAIRDNGIGINQADLPKIFDRGFSGFNGRLNDKASGIGLFIANDISKKLNQPIIVASELGVGTTFSVRLTPTD
ncbi:HAMP domain-containing histidine kinase [Macrococcus hajekii]|uniref:histidine kinase n=1 Tax=Macrococcus hajekii TaxID=198482 RepID=A0A4R6BJ53_9STAP|nr:sensor histidine kinase [Macrococcus hajekii]TDM01723.1 HAMP domain-containing histidine kinase [Macrococcus hajekii]GGB06866.1 sensor histidine kinase [Macrococcus hajekii]